MANATPGSNKRSAATPGANTNTTTNPGESKSQKHYEQLRRLILGKNPRLEEVQAIIQRDPSCLQQTDSHHGLLPLHWACVFQNPMAIVQCLLEAYPNAIEAVDGDGRTPLHHACRPEGRVELVEYLLEHNRRVVTMRDHRGKTPLHCACAEFVPSEIVQLLLQANPAAVKIRTRTGQTPLQCACEYSAPLDTIKVLVDAYPEAVKYIRASNEEGGKFAQAKEYLAWKVREAEEQAEQANKQGRSKTPVRYDEGSFDAPNQTTGSDQMRRRLEEEERKIELEEQQRRHQINTAQQQQDMAMKRLHEQRDLDVERKAAELDRLIQQKEAQAETERFQRETERLFGKRALNDSGIGANRSFNATNSPAPVFQRDHSNNPPITSTKPSNAETHYMTPSVLSSRGVSATGEEEEDDPLFGALRSTQPLYPESKVNDWMSPSYNTAEEKKFQRDPSGDGEFDLSASVPPAQEKRQREQQPYTAQAASSSPNALQEQLQHALRMLEETEQRRKKEMQEAHAQQTALQSELGRLMEKLEEPQEPKKKAPAVPVTQERPPTHPVPNVSVPRAPPAPQKSMGISSAASIGSLPAAQKNTTEKEAATPSEDNNMKDGKGRTPLHIACAHGPSYASVQLLLQQFPLAVYHTDDDGNTPLHYACSCEGLPLEILQLLLDIFPAACWITNQQGEMPFHLACKHHGKRVEVLQLLMETARAVDEAARDEASSIGPSARQN